MALRNSSISGSGLRRGEPPTLIPYLFLDDGKLVRPVPGGFEALRDRRGATIDPFEAADRLVAQYSRVYVVDLDGLRRNRPQLDYLQELARSGDLWVEAGVRTGDQLIDVLVTGARRAVLSTAYLVNPSELRRAWRLSPEIVFALDVENGSLRSRGNEWDGQEPARVAAAARELGISDIVLASRDEHVDWSLASRLARDGSLWVGGGFTLAEARRLGEVGAAGGLFDPPPESWDSPPRTP